LASRIAGTEAVELLPPDDRLLAQLLLKHFSDRQIPATPTLISYLVVRIERSCASAHDIGARLDAAALAEGCAVSRALARRVLETPPRDLSLNRHTDAQ